MYVYPYIMEDIYRINVKYEYHDFREEIQKQEENYEELWKKLKAENQKLFAENQKNLTNAVAYEQSTIRLMDYGFSREYIGFIEIPAMDIKLPIYLGANEENMKKGAVHLTETSYPIGGNNTNCVIAAHRGYSKAAMFRNIETLKEGDLVYIDNVWERLTYEVKECRVIWPMDTEWLKIREGEELLTLITCHPYRHNYQRYIVLCEKRK